MYSTTLDLHRAGGQIQGFVYATQAFGPRVMFPALGLYSKTGHILYLETSP